MDSFFNRETFGPFIDGEFDIEKNQIHPHHSIALRSKWKEIAHTTEADVTRAVDLSVDSLKQLSAYERADILTRLATLVRENEEPLAKCITTEMGKTLRDAKAEVVYAANYFDWFAQEAVRVLGYSIPSRRGKYVRVEHEPVGTVAVITPWNFPIAMAARKVGPAIAAGCSSIVKPSSDTPISMLAIAKLAQEAGLPPRALAVLPGDPHLISETLLADPRVRKLTFTGSTEVGIQLYSQCAHTLKKVTMELGGHAPVLVFASADLDRAVEETVDAKLRVSGQTCVCANRIFVEKAVLEPFLAKLERSLSLMKIGDPFDATTDLTSVLHPTSEKKVPEHIEDAIKKGAVCLLGGTHPYEPTLLTGIAKGMRLLEEETFGPVFPIATFDTEEEAIRQANDTPYGLAAYVFTQDMAQAQRVTKELDYGIIGLNDGLPTSPEVPFGGVKYSGFGREGGPRGIYEYLFEKAISLKY